MEKTEVYEIILNQYINNMLKEIITTQNACNVLQEEIIKELNVARERIFSKHGSALEQSVAFIMALDFFRDEEFTKFCHN